MVRIGFLGVAHPHSSIYIDSLRRARAEVRGLYDLDPERAAWWGSANDVPCFPSGESLASEVDGVLVCAETPYRRRLVNIAAAAGVAVLCEVPLGPGPEDSEAIIDACERARVPLMTALPVRFDPTVLQLRDLVARGDLGRIRAFSGVNQSRIPVRDGSRFAIESVVGEGSMMDNAIHLADAYSWILGSEPEEVYAVGNRIVTSDLATGETSALLIVSYAAGVFGSIDCSWNQPLNYPARDRFALSVVGDDGPAGVEPMRQRLTHFGGPQKYSWLGWEVPAHLPMIQEFLACTIDRRVPVVDGMDGLRASKVVWAALESYRTGTPIRVVPAT